MSHAQPLPRSAWTRWFDQMSDALIGRRAEIEVASLNIGDQIVAEWIPLIGITYDANNDLLDVALERVDHLIRQPREIVIDQDAAGVSSIAVVDAEGQRQIVRLKAPVLLPPGVIT